MALTPGTRIGVYQIEDSIGAGGMGVVYRARDTKLGRAVAVKLLPDIYAGDVDRVARFEREAQILASLNHHSIAQIYGIEDAGSVRALVLELVEGPTVADRIAQGGLTVDEALAIARQIADALEAAHERGIVHRDLKPSNVKVRPDGQVKVLDFGLAKLAMPDAAASGQVDLTASPTLTMHATYAGVILGTAAYMSPEQAKGKPVDRRADIWAFGVVLWEMLTGRQMYEGETAAETLARVIEREPDLDGLPSSTPARIRRLLQRCLTKDPRNRLQAIGEARIVLDQTLARSGEPTAAAVLTPEERSHSAHANRALLWVTTGVLAVALAVVIILWAPWAEEPHPTPLRITADIGVDASLATDVGTAAVLSPDGQVLAIAAQADVGQPSRIYVRRLDQLQATPLSGTEDARAPFFSPDGQWIAFFAGGKLKKVAVIGGAVVTLCDAPTGRGGSWGGDNTIVFQPDIGSTNASLVRVSSAGGTPELLLREEGGRPRFPQVLPGGRAVLYTRYAPGSTAEVIIQPTPAGERKVVQRGGYGRYLPSGHLVYIQDATLFAVRFDLDRLETIGQPVPIVEGIAAAQNMAAAQYSVSDSGTLVYVKGGTVISDRPILWMDRTGKTSPLLAKPTFWSHPRFSPDGRRLAYSVMDGTADIWIYDWARDNGVPFTFGEGREAEPVWTPDGRRIVFRASAKPNVANVANNLYWQRSDGVGEVQRLTENASNQFPGSWHPSGKYLAFTQESAQTNPDIWILEVDGNEESGWNVRPPTVFLATQANERHPAFSPDGKWLAYQSNQSGRFEIYVRPFPARPTSPRQISFGGGRFPVWSRSKSELYFTSGQDAQIQTEATEQQIMFATYQADGDSFQADQPHPWTNARIISGSELNFDLHPDGSRFAVDAVPAKEDAAKQDKIVFVFNFFDELRRLVPSAR